MSFYEVNKQKRKRGCLKLVKCLACTHRKKIYAISIGASLCDATQKILSLEDAVADFPCKDFEGYRAMKDLIGAL